jgi:aryl-alcohol dehydrogenase-like predicted oxidoreductase
LELVERLRESVPVNATMAQFALRWCLEYDAVTTVIPGASKPAQARDNAAASDLAPLSDEVLQRLGVFYREHVAAHIRGGY